MPASELEALREDRSLLQRIQDALKGMNATVEAFLSGAWRPPAAPDEETLLSFLEMAHQVLLKHGPLNPGGS
jgi:hypothetical protein